MSTCPFYNHLVLVKKKQQFGLKLPFGCQNTARNVPRCPSKHGFVDCRRPDFLWKKDRHKHGWKGPHPHSLANKTWFSTAGSGVCELTNQRRLGICDGRALKRHALKQMFQTEGGIQSCNTGQDETTVLWHVNLMYSWPKTENYEDDNEHYTSPWKLYGERLMCRYWKPFKYHQK